MGLCNPSEKRWMNRLLVWEVISCTEEAASLSFLWEQGSRTSHGGEGRGQQKTLSSGFKGLWRGGALRHPLGKRIPPWTDPELLCWELRNSRDSACSNPMLPSPIHTRSSPLFPPVPRLCGSLVCHVCSVDYKKRERRCPPCFQKGEAQSS